MAPLNPNNTQRWFYDYQTAFEAHTFVVRGATGQNITDADSFVAAFLAAVASGFYPFTITTVRHSVAGSDLSFPAASSLEGTSYGAGSGTAETDTYGATYVGRSSGGRRARLVLFGWNGGFSNFRVLSTEVASVAAGVAVLNGATATPCAIDGLGVVWQSYCNIKPYDHWVDKLR